jgi:hypothetical protein
MVIEIIFCFMYPAVAGVDVVKKILTMCCQLPYVIIIMFIIIGFTYVQSMLTQVRWSPQIQLILSLPVSVHFSGFVVDEFSARFNTLHFLSPRLEKHTAWITNQ